MVFSGIRPEWRRHCVGSPCCNELRSIYVHRFYRVADGQTIAEDVPREADVRVSPGRSQVPHDVTVHGNRRDHRTVLLHDERRNKYLPI